MIQGGVLGEFKTVSLKTLWRKGPKVGKKKKTRQMTNLEVHKLTKG